MTFQSILSWGWATLNQSSTVLKCRTLTIKHTQYFNPSELKNEYTIITISVLLCLFLM